MANTAKSVLEIAAAEVGYCRYDDPLAGTKYGRWYEAQIDKCSDNYDFGANGVPFCAMFVAWVFAQASASCAGVPVAYCPYGVNMAKSAGKTVAVKNAQPGDVVYFDWGGDGVSDHVGIVVSNNGSTLSTIEGNTTSGGRDGCVARCTRAYSVVCCVARPDYTSTKTVIEAVKSAVSTKSRLNGIDIASWQGDIADSVLNQCDAVIVKATEDVAYVNPYIGKVDRAIALGKCAGLYHFATVGDARAQADYFYQRYKPYVGKVIPVLDWEASAVAQGPTWALTWLNRLYVLSGVRAIIYMSKSVCRAHDWSAVRAAGFGLWFAQYPNYNDVNGFQSSPWTDSQGTGAWTQPAMFQYTSCGRLSGYDGRLDFNLFYGSESAWGKYAAKSTVTTTAQSYTTTTTKEFDMATLSDIQRGSTGTTVKTAQSVLDDKFGYDLAIDGDFGSCTDTAVRRFQTTKGLSVDGVIGPCTWEALLR